MSNHHDTWGDSGVSDFCGTITGAKAHHAAGQDLCHECRTHLRQRRAQCDALLTDPKGDPWRELFGLLAAVMMHPDRYPTDPTDQPARRTP